jgi:hypothetical protein
VAAAVSAHAITGRSPGDIAALTDDGPALWALATGVRKLGRASGGDAADALAQPWIDRAVELDVQERSPAGRAQRGRSHRRPRRSGDVRGARARAERLAEARVARGSGRRRGPGAAGRARRRSPRTHPLAEDRPDAALRASAAPAIPGCPRIAAGAGAGQEYADDRTAARPCHEQAARGRGGAPGDGTPRRRGGPAPSRSARRAA